MIKAKSVNKNKLFNFNYNLLNNFNDYLNFKIN